MNKIYPKIKIERSMITTYGPTIYENTTLEEIYKNCSINDSIYVWCEETNEWDYISRNKPIVEGNKW